MTINCSLLSEVQKNRPVFDPVTGENQITVGEKINSDAFVSQTTEPDAKFWIKDGCHVYILKISQVSS